MLVAVFPTLETIIANGARGDNAGTHSLPILRVVLTSFPVVLVALLAAFGLAAKEKEKEE